MNDVTAAVLYPTSRIKRERSTKAALFQRRRDLFEIVDGMKPMTVRQVFYQATVRGIVEKAESGYGKIQTDLVAMRRSGQLPYSWLADNTRWQRKPETYSSIEQALQDTARYYRKALWDTADSYVEIWLEKDALSGVVLPVTGDYDVPLMVARGYASLSFLSAAADHIQSVNKPTYIYHLGDYDPSGVNAGEKIESTLRELAPEADITFARMAVTLDQIEALKLPTRPTKQSDTRAKGFGNISVELDAIDPDTLRALVRFWIEQHMPAEELEVLKVAERSERALLRNLCRQAVGQVRGGA